MTTPRWLLPALAGALLIFGIVSGVSASHASGEARLARQMTSQALKDAARAASAAANAQREADAFRVQRDSAINRAARVSVTAAVKRAEFVAIASAAPDTCLPVILAADSALAAADSVQHELRAALTASERVGQALQAEVDTLVPALQKLRTASTVLVKVDTKLAHRALLAKLLPHLGVGAAAGLDRVGAPHLITGATLGWSF